MTSFRDVVPWAAPDSIHGLSHARSVGRDGASIPRDRRSFAAGRDARIDAAETRTTIRCLHKGQVQGK